MSRLKKIYSDFYWKPLTEDVEELLARFQQTDSVRFEVFAAIWREMSFSDVFRGLPKLCEMKRFCRVAMATAVKYFLPPYSYQIQVGGLYLMYGFYHTQLAIPRAKIRLALRTWEHVQKFIRDSQKAQHHDVVYILQRLFAAKAIHYTAMPHLLTFRKERQRKAENMETMCAAFLGRSTKVQELVSSEMLEEVANIQSHYEKMKKAMEKSGQITMAHPNFHTLLHNCAAEFVSWQEKNFPQVNQEGDKRSGGEEKPVEAESSSRAQLLSNIKSKSYGSYQEASRSRRHRKAEMVDSSASGVEQNQLTANGRPLSLRARTRKKLRVKDEKSNVQSWLLSVPEQQKVPLKRTDQVAPFMW